MNTINNFFVDYKIQQLEFTNAQLKRRIECLNKLVEELRKQIKILEDFNDKILDDKEASYIFEMED